MKLERFDFEAAFGTGAQLPLSNVPEVAFAGRSNVGKSSLLNKLLNRKSLARVSSMPGKTVTVNFYSGDGVRLVDLPGYGYARVSDAEKQRWSELMESYFCSGRNIKLVIQLTDMRHKLTKEDLEMLRFLKKMNFDFLIILTKSDKLNKTERSKRLDEIKEELRDYEGVEVIPFSAVTGEGVEKIRKQIDKYTESE